MAHALISLYKLLDDDEEVVGKLHQNQIQDDLKLAPAPSSKIGHDYLELNTLPEDELPEMLGVSSIFTRSRL